MKPRLVELDYANAAQKIGCEIAAIKAVCEVEAPGGGFNPDDTPVTLFEGHKFYLYTKGRYAQSNPTLCYPKWTRQFYGKTWQEEQKRLQDAMALDRTAALMSASWGKFQICGFNFALCGYKTLQQFVNAMYDSETEQLDAFVDYVTHTGLSDELRDKRWADFARLYNGVAYKANAYDTKLATAYAKYKV